MNADSSAEAPRMIVDLPRLGPGAGEGAVTRLFHRTTCAAAESILASGFRDDNFMVRYAYQYGLDGVFFSLWAPYNEGQGAHGGAVLSLDLPTAAAMRYLVWEDWWEEFGAWLIIEAIIPAYVVNRHGPLTVVEWEPAWEAFRPRPE